MIDFTYFKYPEEITFFQALDQNLVQFDTLKNHCNTVYTIDTQNKILSYVDSKGNQESYKITQLTKSTHSIQIEFEISNDGQYHFLFGENQNGDTSLISRKKEPVNKMITGFFTNKVYPPQ